MTDQTDKDNQLNNESIDEPQAQSSSEAEPELDTVVKEEPNVGQEDLNQIDENDESPRTKSTSRFLLVVIVLVILLLGLSGFGGWWVWQQSQTQIEALDAQNKLLADQIAAAQVQITEVSNRRASYADGISNEIAKIEALVVQSAQRMNRQADQTENRWPLEEALTLTRLAQRRLFLDKNAAVSISLLKSADDILASLDAAAVLPLREQIAKDILALRNAQSIDLNGTYFHLAAIADAVRELTWLPKPALAENIEPEANLVEGFWQSIKQVVVVTRMDDIVQAPPLQSDFELWRQHTLMVLAQAQLALLAQNQALYETAIAQSIDQLSQMKSQFDFTAYLDQLTQLKRYKLNPTWPDIGNSVNQLNDYIQQQNESEQSASEEVQS
ncbi:uroporphyrinogen-III C-methyltransferase [Reinekea marina]|uniref:Uroporphyrinogen-III C-methyltransferase n=1 Tax=Reinekea marina TaxID=1310421 RepID=A0ABV7WM54_9GAMM|nr:uroporphyrinogen-III C-methyltransferase [Reinekea marina]MDN3648374.1 uroporphyrinogen-III C-methyltransferase [Reinekea marina]